MKADCRSGRDVSLLKDSNLIMKNNRAKSPVYTLRLGAIFLAMCLLRPFFTGQVSQMRSILLPMHLPVLLCGQKAPNCLPPCC